MCTPALIGPMNLSDNLYGELHPEFEGQSKDTTDIFYLCFYLQPAVFVIIISIY